ncbi:50S ribosomal protein L18 [Geobacter sp. SVR]|uniref:50S ribosomal protein L18 n=1 Tax=Geobacter sp. SVR TaxID=2495594 RepID=UPI00143EFD0E|nr:50S ribosomal protein L18 [Geobacter sp. SVR]BCS53073.1 50S ribosomal protein L18 [Geobacter sp. SVR]GCF84458.1 50S ribosomal protein L18 [Geobacter sp. SVR]
MAKTALKTITRLKRQVRVRKKVRGTTERPRLNVFKSAKHIYAQIIDDTNGVTLAAYSTLSSDSDAATGNVSAAVNVGQNIARLSIEKGITSVVFDRNGFLYHGRIKALADAAREAGLLF